MTYLKLFAWTVLAAFAYIAMIAIGCIAVMIGTPIAHVMGFSKPRRTASFVKFQA
jgi:hypothetical protein